MSPLRGYKAGDSMPPAESGTVLPQPRPVSPKLLPFPNVYSAYPVTDPDRFFLHPLRSGYWVVSPEPGRWVLYTLATKEPAGWEDVTEPERGRKVHAFH
jgi:hypothetical protein